MSPDIDFVVVYIDHKAPSGNPLAWEDIYHLPRADGTRETFCGKRMQYPIGEYVIVSRKTAKRIEAAGLWRLCQGCEEKNLVAVH